MAEMPNGCEIANSDVMETISLPIASDEKVLHGDHYTEEEAPTYPPISSRIPPLWGPIPKKVLPLSFTRPCGRYKFYLREGRCIHDHGFVFSRPATRFDLAAITPSLLDPYDNANYRFSDPFFVSRHNPRFVLADIEKIDAHSIIAMLAKNKCLVMRTLLQGRQISVYLMGDHTWALWAWVEAAARREIQPYGNRLVHIDDHSDLSGGVFKEVMDPLSLGTIDNIMADFVLINGGRGVDRFIVPAMWYDLVRAYFWIYDGTAITAETQDVAINGGDWLESIYGLPKGKIYGSRKGYNHYLKWLELRAHTPSNLLNSRGCISSFRCMADAHCVDKNGLSLIYGRSASKNLGEHDAGNVMLDVDVDVSDETEGVVRIVRPHIEKGSGIGCITIAISPEYGEHENHIEKAMSVLNLIRQHR